jgi:hypothetical protein
MKENLLAHGKICWEIITDWKYISVRIVFHSDQIVMNKVYLQLILLYLGNLYITIMILIGRPDGPRTRCTPCRPPTSRAARAPPTGAKDELYRLMGNDGDVRLYKMAWHVSHRSHTTFACRDPCRRWARTSDLYATLWHWALSRCRAPYVSCVSDVCFICFI